MPPEPYTSHPSLRAQWRMPDEAFLQSVEEVYEQGRILDALRLAESFAPLGQWSGAKACVVAARIAMHTGSDRLALRLTVRARRLYPDDPDALLQYAYELRGRRGALAAWNVLCGRTYEDVPALLRAELLGLKGVCAATLRDFPLAEQLLSAAEALAPGHPLVRIHWAQVYEASDRLGDALVSAQEACALYKYPCYRSGVQIHASILQLLGRSGEAIDLLREASSRLQHAQVELQLYALFYEAGRWAEACDALERFVGLSPLLDEAKHKWVGTQRALLAYHQGHREEAARLARAGDDAFSKQFAARLECAPVTPERVCLGVVFVRQHFNTCAPATLAALGRFWGMPAEHLAMVAEMCYDGTPHWQQRDWAEKNGWVVREFRVTPENTIELTLKGVPFAISVVNETSAHMMAMIGFDRAKGVLLLRDPGQPYVVEMEMETFLERYSPFGPRGVVFLPEAMRQTLDGVALPDEAIYDLQHRFAKELEAYRREQAAEIVRQMEAEFPGHWMMWETRQRLAAYDANVTEQIRCLDHLDARFPKNTLRLLQRLWCLHEAPREEKMRLLQPLCEAKNASPTLHLEYATLLRVDARLLPQARAHLRVATSKMPLEPNVLRLQADIFWDTGDYARATERYRFAACLDGFNETRFQSWFIACRRTRRTDEAIAYLQDRFARLGGLSGQPALTLVWAWTQLDQPDKAREVLAHAIRQRPHDGTLLLRAAGLASALGEHAEATRLLDDAKDKARRNDWLRAAAETAERRSDYALALTLLRELVALESSALDGHEAIVRLLARLEGSAAVQAHLQAACEQLPFHCGLHRQLAEHLRGGDPAVQEDAIRQLIRIAPEDTWAHRELALFLAQTPSKRFDEAIAAAHLAVTIEPYETVCHSVLGSVYEACGRPDDARQALRHAIGLSVDNAYAIQLLLQLEPTDNARKEALDFIGKELLRQVVFGDGLLAYQEQARTIIDPPQLLAFLREAHRERPDLWHAWSALIVQLGQAGQLDEALDIALQATSRFPHLPRLWSDLAQVHSLRNEPEQEIAAFERALALVPHDTWTTTQLARLRVNQNDREGAAALLKNLLRSAPTDIETAHTLLNIQLEMNDLADAEDTLAVMRAHQPGAPTLVAEIRLKLKQPGADDPEAAFEAICASADPDPWPMTAAYDELAHAKRHGLMKRVLERTLKQPSYNPHVPATFARLLLDKRAAFRAVLFFLRLPEGEPQYRTATTLLNGLAQQRHPLALRLLLCRRRKAFAQRDESWGMVGYALCTLNRMRATAHWLADWHTRADIQPWMLANLCIALRHLGQYDEANTVATFSVARWGHTEGTDFMHLFLSLDCAITGRVEEARTHLRHIATHPNAPEEQKLLTLAKALVAFLETPEPERRQAFGAFKESVSSHFLNIEILYRERDLQRTFRNAGRTIIQNGGGWPARWYFMRKKIVSCLALVFCIALFLPVAAGVITGRFNGGLIIAILITAWLMRKRA